jgi:hypothetical protein
VRTVLGLRILVILEVAAALIAAGGHRTALPVGLSTPRSFEIKSRKSGPCHLSS